MGKTIFIVFLVGAGIVILLNNAGVATACPEDLECANFTESDKKSDCRYILNQGFSRGEEQDVLCILWHQSYGYPEYSQPDYDYDFSIESSSEKIDNSQFILAGKILVFGFLNYFTFNLTKSSVILKWLHVA